MNKDNQNVFAISWLYFGSDRALIKFMEGLLKFFSVISFQMEHLQCYLIRRLGFYSSFRKY
jgi:hypothetical protein